MDEGGVVKRLIVSMTAAAVTLLVAAPAWAHVTVQPSEAIAESFAKFVMRVPNERDDANTTKLVVQFPAMAFVSFEDVSGWTRDVQMRKLNKPLKAFGESLKEVVGTVTWSGGKVEPGEFIEFPFSAAMPAGEVQLKFPAIQTYDSGEVVKWTGPESADTPASILSTVELGNIAEPGSGELENLHEAIHILEDLDGKVDKLQVAVGNQPSGSDASGSPDDSDTLPLILGGAGAVLGLFALLVALSKRKTS
jgi:uncharacterized protein YcnI